MLITDKVGGYCFAILLVISIIQLTHKKNREFDQISCWMVLVFGCYPFIVLINLLFQAELRIDEFDDTSRFLLVIPIYLALRGQKSVLNAAALGALVGLLAAIFMAVNSMVLGTEIRFGGYENPVAFSQAAVLLACLSGCISINTSRKLSSLEWIIAPLALVSTAFTSLASQTRTTIFSAILLAPLAFSKTISLKKRLLYLALSLAIFTLLCVALARLFGAPHVTESSNKTPEIVQALIVDGPYRTVEILLNEDSTSLVSLGRRGALWIAGTDAILANPVFGIGKGNFQEFVQKSSSLSTNMKDSISIYSHAHNDLIQVTAELGLIGLASYIIFILGSVVIAATNNIDSKSQRLVFMAAMSFLCCGLTQSALVGSQNITLAVTMMIALGLSAGYSPISDEEKYNFAK